MCTSILVILIIIALLFLDVFFGDPGDPKGQISWIWGSSCVGVVACVFLWGRCVLDLATTLEREAKMQNIDAFLWRRCFLDFGHHARARSKIIKEGIKKERQTHTTVKSRFECAITLKFLKKHEEN